jgi:DNA-binding MarR family transcriptional regulator
MATSSPTVPERAPLTPFRELIRVFGLLERVMNPYFARFGITGAQWGVLRNLHRAEQEGHVGLRPGDLAERLLVRPPSVTTLVDRLERAGLVRRDGVPEDQRAKVVVLTSAGHALLERVLAVHDGQIAAVMGGLSAADQAQLGRLLYRMGRHLETLAEGGRLEKESA